MMRYLSLICVGCLLPYPSLPVHAQPPATANGNWAAEPQPRGPVHEGFVQPFSEQPEPGPVVPSKPPDPIPEMPPEMAPGGSDVQWIPGYWAWDAQKGEFLWVSGTYRHAPPGRQFVPGYWMQAGEGWRWVPGYWAPVSAGVPPQGNGPQAAPPPAMQYTPQPPAPLQTAPTQPGPPDAIYNPGYWAYQNQSFAWRPGSYYQGIPGRIWIPPYYAWTPSGYLFVPGYWDYPLDNRGLLFAPVSFTGPLWQTPGWSYTPLYAINTGSLLDCLFFNGPSCWFGNYYGPFWAGRGFRPWYTGYGPYLGYYRWANRGNPGWYGGLQRNYAARAGGSLAVPGRGELLTPLNRVPNLNRLSAAQLTAQRSAALRTRDLAQQRIRHEARLAHAPGVAGPARVQPIRPATTASRVAAPAVHTPVQQAHVPAVRPAPHNSPASAVHHTPAAHNAPAVHHAAPTVHHAAPTVHHAAAPHHAAPAAHHPAANHHASAGHGGGHSGGGHSGHHH